MASHKSVVHIERGFRMSRTYAEQVMREHCTITWHEDGVSVRDTTNEERITMRAEQANKTRLREMQEGVLGMRNDLKNIKFVPPKGSTYRAPREAYEEIDSPLGLRVCRWPRRVAA